jgi:hypothetical protein
VGQIILSAARGCLPFFFAMMAVLVAASAAQHLHSLTILSFLVAIFLAGLCAGLMGSVYAMILSSGVLMGTPLVTVELHAPASTFWFAGVLVICLASLVRWAMRNVQAQIRMSSVVGTQRLRSPDENALAPFWQIWSRWNRRLEHRERDRQRIGLRQSRRVMNGISGREILRGVRPSTDAASITVLRIGRWWRPPISYSACQPQVSRGAECEIQNVLTGSPRSLHARIPCRGRVEQPCTADSPDPTGGHD